MNRLIGLLDRPSPRSFGMTPIITADDSDRVAVHGLVPESSHRARHVSRADVEDLIRTHNATRVPENELKVSTPEDVALWVGEGFSDQAGRLGLEVKGLPELPIHVSGGTAFVAPAKDLFVYLSTWIERAFQLVRNEGDREKRRQVASLMRWTLPDHPLTLVASWKAAAEPEKELAFQLRDNPGLVREQWLAQAERLWRHHAAPLSTFKTVVAFIGPKGSHREEIARELADSAQVAFAQFREVLSAPEHVREGKVDRLMIAGELRVQQSPLGLTNEVLTRHREVARGVLVVDGLRHSRILEAMYMIGLNELIIVSVEPDEIERRKELASRGLNPDDIAQHSTERDIPDLAKSAEFHIRERSKQEDLGPLLERLRAA
jgi:hypothetical protein